MIPDTTQLLDHTFWIDIGLGRSLQSLSAKEIAELKRCQAPTMGFQRTDRGWVQTFYPGVAMRTAYASAVAESDGSVATIRFFSEGRSAPAETVRLLNANSVLVQETPGFRPHTFLKCVIAAEPKSRR